MKTKITEKKEIDFFPFERKKIIDLLGKEKLLDALDKMLLIRNFELRAESAYLQGKIGGFFHSYVGQEAIQTSLLAICGTDHWYAATYRCHALALLLGATPNELMAELYGRANGNAWGRGGSMHLYTDRLLGGFGIVGGQVPIAIGAAFSLKYQKQEDKIAICFLGDGAVAQGAFHESLNLASLWDLPCLFVIENNQWGMGTGIERAIAVERLAEEKASGYRMNGYTFDGMDFFSCYAGFSHVYEEVRLTQRPVLVEVCTQRFRGHSISDPGLYRSKEELEKVIEQDSLIALSNELEDLGMLTKDIYKDMDKRQRKLAIDAMKYADESPWPDLTSLEEGVYAP